MYQDTQELILPEECHWNAQLRLLLYESIHDQYSVCIHLTASGPNMESQ